MAEFAAHLTQAADRLDSAHGELGVRLGHVEWLGGFAERFKGDWHGSYRAQVERVASQLREVATQINQELAAQQTASGAGGGAGASHLGGAPGGLPRAPFNPFPFFRSHGTQLLAGGAFVTGGLAMINRFGRPASAVGRYTDVWRGVISHGGDLAKYKSSEVIQAAQHNPVIRNLAEFEEHNKAYGVASKVIGGALIAQQGVEAFHHLQNHDVAGTAGDVADGVATGLKMSHNPVAYMAGVDISLWHEVGKQAQVFARDFRPEEGLPNPFGKDGGHIYAEAAKDVGKQLLNIVPSLF